MNKPNTNKVNVFVVGAPKAGTTTLFDILSQSKDIILPVAKEPNYFCTDYHERWELYKKTDAKEIKKFPKSYKPGLYHSARTYDLQKYEKMFFSHSDKYTLIDFSTTYLSSTTAPKLIFNYNPNAKIIMMLRDPLSRAWSHYCMDLAIGYHKKKFIDCLKEEQFAIDNNKDYPYSYIRDSNYFKSFQLYSSIFEKKNILLVDFDKFIKNQKFEVQNISNFIGIDSFKYKLVKNTNSSRAMRFENLRWIYTYLLRSIINKISLSKRIKVIGKNIIFKNTHFPKPDDKITKKFFEKCKIM